MTITPLGGPWVPPSEPGRSQSTAHPTGERRADSAHPEVESTDSRDSRARDGAPSELEELQEFAGQARLELRLRELPDNAGTLIRFVEPNTGEVVREFPPEGLARALAEMRARAASRIDRQA